MQMPQMAMDVFMRRFITLAGVAVKPKRQGNSLESFKLKQFIKHGGAAMKHCPARRRSASRFGRNRPS
jgi:hypothetical protein